MLDTDSLHEALRDQVGNKLARCLHWEHSQHVFIPEDHGIKTSTGDVQVQIEPLLLAGITRHYSKERVRGVLAPFWNDPAELRGDPDRIATLLAIDEAQRATLAAIDGRSSVGDILRSRNKQHVQAAAHLLVALALTDQLEAPDAIAPEESGPFKVEDLARRQPSVPRPEPAVGDSVRPALREVTHLPGKEKLLADSAFLQGKELMRAREYGAAADAFREASNLRPNALEYALFAGWAAYLSLGRAVKWRDMLVDLCERTLAQDRHLAFGYHVRGQLALETRSLDVAREAFAQALELDPSDDEARRLLARVSN
jgi:tetratricopeptide (TPR) repeat protein